MRAPSPESKNLSDESSSSSLRIESESSVITSPATATSPSPSVAVASSTHEHVDPACRPRLPRDPTLIQGGRQRQTMTEARRRSKLSSCCS